MSTYLDAHGCPAIRMAFGYSRDTDLTTEVLTVRAGRAVVLHMTPDQFEAEYMASTVPHDIALQTIERVARRGGCDLEVRRLILWYSVAPIWKLQLIDLRLALRSRFRALLAFFVRRPTRSLGR